MAREDQTVLQELRQEKTAEEPREKKAKKVDSETLRTVLTREPEIILKKSETAREDGFVNIL
jgi:hypothetical protein